ncbi:hypothetical protein KY285_033686 [Solanum tuberosum]|nr:hypothetical protein KY284_033526 [Solanum tuberosum]KAH0648438.1 hypothetical protein KY285_033686 [Solanum tuberosum]
MKFDIPVVSFFTSGAAMEFVAWKNHVDCLKQRNDNKGMGTSPHELLILRVDFCHIVDGTQQWTRSPNFGVANFMMPNWSTNYLKTGDMILLSDEPREMVKKEDIVQGIDERFISKEWR